jgi:hypothetical protein
MLDCPFDAVKAKAWERFFETEAGFMKQAREGTREQKLAALKNIGKSGIDKRDEILCVLAEDADGEVRKSVMEYPYLPEKAWVNMINKASSDSEALEILDHPKCPEAVIDTILAENSPYSDDVFIAALSTDHAVKKLKDRGFTKLINYTELIFNNLRPPYSKQAIDIDFSRIRNLGGHHFGPYPEVISNILKRTYKD